MRVSQEKENSVRYFFCEGPAIDLIISEVKPLSHLVNLPDIKAFRLDVELISYITCFSTPLSLKGFRGSTNVCQSQIQSNILSAQTHVR